MNLAERFLTAWKRLEQHLRDLDRRGNRGADMEDLLRSAERDHLITASAHDFLQACRRARNAYAHIAFDGYDGPVTLPPRPVVERLERLSVGLVKPGRASAVASRAVICEATTTLREALQRMHESDLSQLPYREPGRGWSLFTRQQVALLVHSNAVNDDACLVDPSMTVGQLADLLGGPTVATILPRSVTAGTALERMESALVTPDHQPGGYPAVLLVDEAAPSATPLILTPDDLPALYDLLGR